MAAPVPPATPMLTSLQFPDRRTLLVQEIAACLRCTPRHIINLTEDGSLASVNIASKQSTIICHRVPIESWLDFIAMRYSGVARSEALRRMPRRALEELHREIGALLANPTRRLRP